MGNKPSLARLDRNYQLVQLTVKHDIETGAQEVLKRAGLGLVTALASIVGFGAHHFIRKAESQLAPVLDCARDAILSEAPDIAAFASSAGYERRFLENDLLRPYCKQGVFDAEITKAFRGAVGATEDLLRADGRTYHELLRSAFASPETARTRLCREKEAVQHINRALREHPEYIAIVWPLNIITRPLILSLSQIVYDVGVEIIEETIRRVWRE